MELSTRMQKEGIHMVEVPMQVRYMSEPMKALQSLVDNGRLKHDGNPVLSWMMGNLMGQLDLKENVFPRKARMANKIDGAVATIMGLSRSIIDVPRTSIYEAEDMDGFRSFG
jgi:phage terminase large subunit-like protein